MDTFKKLFGVDKDFIMPHCLLLPLSEMQLFGAMGPGAKAHGDYFRVMNTSCATLIGTHYSLLVGDCVLNLKDTACENIYLFGCAGGIGVDVGSRILVEKAYNFESFGLMMEGKASGCRQAPGKLTGALKAASGAKTIPGVCATVASLALEEKLLPEFRRLGVNCLDMECSQVFAAAEAAGKNAAAMFYVSDVVPDKPWHEFLSKEDIARLGAARRNLADFIAGFIANSRNGVCS